MEVSHVRSPLGFSPSPEASFLVHLLSTDVGPMLRELRGGALAASREWKGMTDFRTHADTLIEEKIVSQIRTRFPNVGIYGEEGGEQGARGSATRFVIDPIDGTIPWATGFGDHYTIATAVLRNDAVVTSVIHMPHDGRTYVAELGKGAWRFDQNGIVSPLKASDESILQRAVIVVDHGKERREESAEIMRRLLDRKEGVNCIPQYLCASYSMAMIAEGRIHGFIGTSTPPDDALPGMLLASEAGALVSSLDIDRPWSPQHRSLLVAGSAAIRAGLLGRISTGSR